MARSVCEIQHTGAGQVGACGCQADGGWDVGCLGALRHAEQEKCGVCEDADQRHEAKEQVLEDITTEPHAHEISDPATAPLRYVGGYNH
jgi:hypothetical protein